MTDSEIAAIAERLRAANETRGVSPELMKFHAYAPQDVAALLAAIADARIELEQRDSMLDVARSSDEAQRATVKAQAELMCRAVKYAREDRMETPGYTRLRRVLDEMERALRA